MISEIHKEFFIDQTRADWDKLGSSSKELSGSVSDDFSIDATWGESIQKIGIFALKCILLPWGLYRTVKAFTRRVIMMALYPAQNSLIKLFTPTLRTGSLDLARNQKGMQLKYLGFVVRHVSLNYKGTRYSGLMIGEKSQIGNGKWAIQALGNAQAAEHVNTNEFAKSYAQAGFNLLLVNGPGVGRSEGFSSPKTMGNAQEVGLCFLETAVRAKKIAMAGFSLGGAAMSSAILQHEFKPKVKYLCISEMTFDRVSNICARFIGAVRTAPLVRGIVRWAECEIDQVEAAKKLQKLEIPHIIINAGDGKKFIHDGVVAGEATLAHALEQEGITKGKRLWHTVANHCRLPMQRISANVERWSNSWAWNFARDAANLVAFPLGIRAWRRLHADQ